VIATICLAWRYCWQKKIVFYGVGVDERPVITFGNITMFAEDEIEVLDKLGEGNYGMAHRARIRERKSFPGRIVVLKTSKLGLGFSQEDLNELVAMSHLKRNENLLQLVGLVSMQKKLCFLVEYCEKGSLDRLHKIEDMLGVPRYLEIIRDVSSGLKCLHESHFIHRDLACRNLLMKENGKVVVADYGLARKLERNKDDYDINTSHVPWAWTAPEVLKSWNFTMSSDIWSFGVAMWEIATRGGVPYATHDPGEAIELIKQGKLELDTPPNIKIERPFIDEIVRKCLRMDPKERPTAHEVLHLALKELNASMDSKGTPNYSASGTLGSTRGLGKLSVNSAIVEDQLIPKHRQKEEIKVEDDPYAKKSTKNGDVKINLNLRDDPYVED